MVTWEKTGTGSPIYYLYDANGDLWGLNHNGNIYFYVRNAQNDIIKIVDGSGVVVVTYSYDAWGNILDIAGTLASTLGQDNPFRYRGYYYDTEVGLFDVGSRYYDPEIGRFIYADGYVQTPNGDLTSTNMFVYCGNNPVHRYDPTGEFFLDVGNVVV